MCAKACATSTYQLCPNVAKSIAQASYVLLLPRLAIAAAISSCIDMGALDFLARPSPPAPPPSGLRACWTFFSFMPPWIPARSAPLPAPFPEGFGGAGGPLPPPPPPPPLDFGRLVFPLGKEAGEGRLAALGGAGGGAGGAAGGPVFERPNAT